MYNVYIMLHVYKKCYTPLYVYGLITPQICTPINCSEMSSVFTPPWICLELPVFDPLPLGVGGKLLLPLGGVKNHPSDQRDHHKANNFENFIQNHMINFLK